MRLRKIDLELRGGRKGEDQVELLEVTAELNFPGPNQANPKIEKTIGTCAKRSFVPYYYTYY